MQNKWYYIKALVNNFNVNGNTIIGFCPQIQVSVYRTLIETCQVIQAYKIWVVPSRCFSFSAQFSLRLPHYLQAGDRQLPTIYYSMKKYQIRARGFWSLKANWCLRFSLPQILLADLVGNRSLRQRLQKVMVCDLWLVDFEPFRVFLCFKFRWLWSWLWFTAAKNAVNKGTLEIQSSLVFERLRKRWPWEFWIWLLCFLFPILSTGMYFQENVR